MARRYRSQAKRNVLLAQLLGCLVAAGGNRSSPTGRRCSYSRGSPARFAVLDWCGLLRAPAGSVALRPFESRRVKLGVDDGALDVSVAEESLNRPRIHALLREVESLGVPEHVRVHRERQPGLLSCPLHDVVDVSSGSGGRNSCSPPPSIIGLRESDLRLLKRSSIDLTKNVVTITTQPSVVAISARCRAVIVETTLRPS